MFISKIQSLSTEDEPINFSCYGAGFVYVRRARVAGRGAMKTTACYGSLLEHKLLYKKNRVYILSLSFPTTNEGVERRKNTGSLP